MARAQFPHAAVVLSHLVVYAGQVAQSPEFSADDRVKLLRTHVALDVHWRRNAAGFHRLAQRLAQLPHHSFDCLFGFEIALFRIVPLSEADVTHDERGVAHIVVDHHGLGKHKGQVREVEVRGIGVRNVLDEAHPVVSHHPDGAPDEAGQIEVLGGDMSQFSQAVAQKLEGITLDLPSPACRSTLRPPG